ncbi:hypothetical protein V8F20_001156 [Naviculisporaceae sp. PSN 640]
MSNSDEEDIRSNVSNSRFGDNTRLLLGKVSNVTNNLTLKLSPEEDVGDPEKANKTFLESLGPINPIVDKLVFDGINTELPSDGFDWVLEQEQYKTWRADEGLPILWIQDETGAGHTPLTLRLLDRWAQSTQRSQPLVVAYCFCQGGARMNRTITDALQGLLTSIFQQDNRVLTHIRAKLSRWFQTPSEVDRNAHFIFQKLLVDTLQELVSRGRPVYLIIDGLSNLVANSTGQDANQVLRSLISQIPGLKWLITSRSRPPRLWTSTKSNRLINELVLSGTGVAKGLGLEHAVEIITKYGNGFRSIYKKLIPQERSSEYLSWFEYTSRGRAWLVRPTVVWYRSTETGRGPCDLSLKILQKVHEWHGEACCGAYFSFSFVRPSRQSSDRTGCPPSLNPTPALWCLFTQLVCEIFPDQNEIGLFLSSLPRTQQSSLRDVCVLVNDLTSSQWLEPDIPASRPGGNLKGWVPFEEWVGFLDDSYCQLMCSLLAGIISRSDNLHPTLVIDSMHLADLKSWIYCLKSLGRTVLGPAFSSRLFISGAYDSEKECELRDDASLQDAIDEHTEYQECLNQLYFDKIHYRRERVQEALQDTNQWIWKNPAYNRWKTTGGLLWISGKAGSGKSLLAKTIHRDFRENLWTRTVKGKAGVTLWVRLVLEQLLLRVASSTETGFSLLDLKEILINTPTEVKDLYGHILLDLGLSPGSPKLAVAKRMFKWIVGSISWEPLQLQDFLDAIAIPENNDQNCRGPDDPILSRRYQIGDNWNQLRKIIFQHCGPLVEILKSQTQTQNNEPVGANWCAEKVEPTWKLQLIHQTVKTFLEESSARNPIYIHRREAERAVLDGCYYYLKLVLPNYEAPYLPSQRQNRLGHLGVTPRENMMERRALHHMENSGSIAQMSTAVLKPPSLIIPQDAKALGEPTEEFWAAWLEYSARHPFTRYALRVLQNDKTTRPRNWLVDSIFSSEESGNVVSDAFPLWWAVASFIPAQTVGQEDYIRDFARCACARGDIVSLEIFFEFAKLLEGSHFWTGNSYTLRTRTKRHASSLLKGAIDPLLATAAMYPACCYPLADVLLEMYNDNEEMDKLSVTALIGEDALNDDPIAIALSTITYRAPRDHPEVNEPMMSQEQLYNRHCKKVTIPIRSVETPGHVIYVPVWKMHQATRLLLAFIRLLLAFIEEFTNASPDLPPKLDGVVSSDSLPTQVWDRVNEIDVSSTSSEPEPDSDEVERTRRRFGVFGLGRLFRELRRSFKERSSP